MTTGKDATHLLYSREGTSRDAAESVEPVRLSMRERVFQYIAGCGAAGATDFEIEAMLGMLHQTASARRNELERDKRIKDSGQRRKTASGRWANVWVVVLPEPAQGVLL